MAWSSNVDLPMPGSPPTSTTAPSTSPPPRTRSNSPIPVDTRACSLCRTSLSAVTVCTSTLPAHPSRRAATAGFPAGASTISLSEFHAPQSAHCPCHLLWSAPHSEHTYAERALSGEVLAMKLPALKCHHSSLPPSQEARPLPRAEASVDRGFGLLAPLRDLGHLQVGGDSVL